MNTQMKSTRKVLLIGGAGYVGCVLTDLLLRQGFGVRCLDSFLYWNRSNVSPFLGRTNYEFLCGDFTDKQVMDRGLKGVTDLVILAGLVGDPITKKYPELSKAINLDGMLHMIHSLSHTAIKRLIFVSTCSNYGFIPDNVLADENYELKPLSLYAKAKVALEGELLSIRPKVSYDATILRFATAFGLSSRMRFDLTVNEFTRDMFLDKPLTVYDADTWRPYCHVQDLAAAVLGTLKAPREAIRFEVFNVGGEDNNFSKRMIVDTVKVFAPRAKVSYVSGGVDARNYRVSFKKIRERLSFQPHFSVRAGVQEIIAALKQRIFSDVDADRKRYGNYEIDERAISKHLVGAPR
jgi:nucleoside-diphosphate-sugar epimerase